MMGVMFSDNSWFLHYAQKSVLIPYHETVWNAFHEGVNFEQEWLNSWLNGMTNIKNALKEAFLNQKLIFPNWIKPNSEIKTPPERQLFWYLYDSYVHMTNNRLGILNRDEAYLGYLIKESLKKLGNSSTTNS